MDIEGIEFHKGVALDRYTTIKLGVIGDIAIVHNEDALKVLINQLNKENIKFHLVGWGSNQVIVSSENTVFIKLDFKVDNPLVKLQDSLK